MHRSGGWCSVGIVSNLVLFTHASPTAGLSRAAPLRTVQLHRAMLIKRPSGRARAQSSGCQFSDNAESASRAPERW